MNRAFPGNQCHVNGTGLECRWLVIRVHSSEAGVETLIKFFSQNSSHSADYASGGLWVEYKHHLAKVLPDLTGNVLQLTSRLHRLNPN